MYKRIVTGALLFGMAAIAPPAHAMNCAPREGIVEQLETRYAEKLSARGMQNSNTLLEIWTSEKTGSFTVIISRADGISCIVSAGTHWLRSAPEVAQERVAG